MCFFPHLSLSSFCCCCCLIKIHVIIHHWYAVYWKDTFNYEMDYKSHLQLILMSLISIFICLRRAFLCSPHRFNTQSLKHKENNDLDTTYTDTLTYNCGRRLYIYSKLFAIYCNINFSKEFSQICVTASTQLHSEANSVSDRLLCCWK